MKRIVLSLSILLLAATESHALRTGSANTLTVQNGAATVACTTGTGAQLLYDIDGSTTANVSSCLTLPTNCSTDRFLRWNTGSNTLTCDLPAASGSALTSFIVTQTQTPIAFDSTAPTVYVGLGGLVRNNPRSLSRLTGSSGSTVTVNNMVCNTHDVPTAGTAVVTLVYNTAGNFASTAAGFTATNLTLTLSNTNNVAAASVNSSTVIPAGAYVGYRIETTSGFTISGEQGADITCTLERTA